MLALVAQQALVVLEAWQDVDHAPEAGPACESAGAHVDGDWAGGGFDFHGRDLACHANAFVAETTASSVIVNVVSVVAET